MPGFPVHHQLPGFTQTQGREEALEEEMAIHSSTLAIDSFISVIIKGELVLL